MAEILMLLVGLLFWALPVALAVWVVLTLYRIRTLLESIDRRLPGAGMPPP